MSLKKDTLGNNSLNQIFITPWSFRFTSQPGSDMLLH